MAHQTGVFKFTGKLGKTVSYTLNGKKVTRTIGEVDLEKMRTAPQYAETRKNQSEFALATKAGQMFRQAMKHMTHGYTNYQYPMDVMRVMINTLRADDTQPKGFKQLNNGLRDPESQMAFRRLNLFSKKSCRHFKGSLMENTADPMVYKLNRHLLWDKAKDGDKKTVRLGYLHIDFEVHTAKYEPALSIKCTRNETIQYSKHTLPTSNEEMTPWTFLIVQVWRESDVYEPARMMFMSVLDVIENGIEDEQPNDEQPNDEHSNNPTMNSRTTNTLRSGKPQTAYHIPQIRTLEQPNDEHLNDEHSNNRTTEQSNNRTTEQLNDEQVTLSKLSVS